MRLQPPKPGAYVIAVSGGVDSVCLLDMLAKTPYYRLTVAHFDHGIREDSSIDGEFVKALSNKYGLNFISAEGKLGPQASEAEAREARYSFLRQAVIDSNSSALITAHHMDDRLETLIINLIRGTGRKGLTSLQETENTKRPLLKVNKQELKEYAHKHNLSWREDSTNSDDRYLRNYVRIHLLPKLSEADRERLIAIMERQTELNSEIDAYFSLLIKNDLSILDRGTVNGLPFKESKELIAAWLRLNNLVNFDRKTIERLTTAAKTKRPGAKIDVNKLTHMSVEKDYLALNARER